jgi:hypothetical protein
LGLAVGQIVGGIALTVGGFTGEVLGGAATVTGIGAAVGVPAMVVSTTLAVGGAGNIAAGIRGLSQSMMSTGSGPRTGYPRDRATSDTNNWSAHFRNEREARSLARQKLGSDPVEIEPGKWRSQDGKWQYRAKPGDVKENHIHLEELDPKTGEVIQNLHLRWPEGAGQ